MTLKMRRPIFKNSLYYLVPNLVSLGNDWSVFTNWLCTGKKHHQISLARDSGALPNLFCWSIFSGFVCINSQLEIFTPPNPHPCQEFVIYSPLWCLSAVLQVLWSCCKPASFLLFSAAPRLLEYSGPISAPSAWDRNKSLGHSLAPKAGTLEVRSNFFLSQGEASSWVA